MPSDTRELITLDQFRLLVMGAAATLAILGLGLAIWWAKRGTPRGWQRGLFVAALGPLLLAMWAAYSAVIDRMGLDSVAALGLNLALFAIAGALLGAVGRWLWSAPGR